MCESCGKSFASKEYLKHHARIHSGSRPYKCEICERAFAQRNSLHQHMKTHTGKHTHFQVCGHECPSPSLIFLDTSPFLPLSLSYSNSLTPFIPLSPSYLSLSTSSLSLLP